MATGSGSRDVTLTLTVDTLGEDGIKQLQTAITALAKEGGLAGPEFKQLADQVARLGEQNAALQTVKKLSDETSRLKAAQADAAQEVSKLGERLDVLKQASAGAADKQREARDAVNEAKKALAETAGEITKLNREFDAAGKKTQEYKDEFNRLTDKQTQGRKELVDLREAQREANAEYTKAQDAVSKLASIYERESKAAGDAAKATADKERALASASDQASKLGVVTDNLATAEGTLIATFNRGVTAINERKAALTEMAESDRLLAIQEQAQIELLKRGEQALQAEVAALRDAERSNEAYAAAKAKATADEAAWQREAFAIVEAKEAAQKLVRETEILVAAEQELAQQNAFGKLADEAKKMQQAADYVRFWETELAKAETQVKETTAAAEAAATKIQNAFKTVGVRSAQELEAEIKQTKAAMETLAAESATTGSTLKGAFEAGNAKINALERDLRELNGTMTLGDKTAKLFAGSMSQIAAGNIIADGVGYLVQKVKDLTVEFFTVNLEAQRLSKALGQVYGDSGLAAKQFAFLRETADRSGLSIRDLSDGFIRFSAAANSSGISLQNANALFAAVTNAAGQLGLRGEQVTGTLEALGQMASKGVVSMEELRQQLGDRLPGALSIAAKGMGVTQEELVKMVESGSLATKVFFPAFEKGLNETFTTGSAKVEGFIQGWNRLVNAIVKTAQAASETSVFMKLGQAFDFVAERIGFVVKAVELLVARFAILKFVELITSFVGIGNAASKAAGDITAKAAAVEKDTIATGLNTTATGANTAATDLNTAAKGRNAAAWLAIGTAMGAGTTGLNDGTTALKNAGAAADGATKAKGLLAGAMGVLGNAGSLLVRSLGGPIGALISLALYAKEAGTAIGETAAKMVGWGKVLEDNEKKLAAQVEAEKKAAEERRKAMNDQDIASVTAATNAEKALKLSELGITAANAEVKAAQQKYASIQDIIKIQGENKQSTDDLLQSSKDILKANEDELAAKEKFIAATKEKIEAIDSVRDANGNLTQGQIDEIKKLEELAKKRQEEVKEQRESVRQSQVEVAARKLAAESVKDNSGRIGELSAAYENAKTKLEVMRDSGVASLGQLQKAEIDLALAAGRKNEAIKDAIRNTEVELKQAAAIVDVKNTESAVRIKQTEVMLAQARQQGRVVDAEKLETQILNENIEILKRKRDLIEKEVDAGLKIIGLKRQQLTADTDDNKAKRALLDVEEELLLARKAGSKSIDEQITGLKNEIKAVEGLTAAYHQLGIKTPEELNQIAEKNAKAWEKIKEDGRASVEQMKTAFEKYAQSVVDAAGDMGREMAESMLKSEGATRNLNIAIDQTGKVTVEAMGKASNAINNARGYMTAFERSALAATEALEAQNASMERRISAQEKANELLERELELERQRLGIDKDGFRVDKDGNRIQIGVENKRTVYDKAKASGLTDAQALAIADRFIDQNGYHVGWEQTGKPWSVAVQEAINAAVIENARLASQQQQQTQERGGRRLDGRKETPDQQTADLTKITVQELQKRSGRSRNAFDNDRLPVPESQVVSTTAPEGILKAEFDRVSVMLADLETAADAASQDPDSRGDWFQKSQAVVSQIMALNNLLGSRTPTANTPPTTTPTPRPTAREQTTTVVINLADGRSKRIDTDPAGATALQEVLRSLETSSRTTL